jgi:predicted alpha-1,2-mannosidase
MRRRQRLRTAGENVKNRMPDFVRMLRHCRQILIKTNSLVKSYNYVNMKQYRKSLLFAFCGMLLLGTNAEGQQKQRRQALPNLTQYVDPTIGTGGHGHVFLGADVPFGFVQLGPSQATQGWDWCSGYNYSDSVLVGFGHMHLSGTGIGDLGDVTFLPTTDGSRTSRFSHTTETARPGYYAVTLEGSGVRAELTATARVGFHRYTYPAGSAARLVVNVLHGIGWDKYVSGNIRQDNDSTISGYRISTGWAKHQEVYFTAVFSAPIKAYSGSDSMGVATFDLPAGHQLLVKVGLSPVSIDNARLNLLSELPGWNFNATASAADALWNKQLNKVLFVSRNASDRKIFYTSLYHTMIAPSLFCDVNGDYYGSDGKIHRNGGFKNYTTFSLWDTYRAAHPLATIIDREMLPDYAQTFLHIFREQGKLPVWHLVGNETDCMVGNPGIPVLADLWLKGVKMDKAAAFEAMKASAMLDERGLKQLKEYGYLPYDKTPGNETVGRGLEYALADWCVGQVAKAMGNQADYKYFNGRSKSYAKYFDRQSQFMRACASDGKFREPFSIAKATEQTPDYTEGNPWQYAWLVPHDVHGLIKLFGGEKPFLARLDTLFLVNGDLGKNAAPDISGLIGQYAHGNEPSHHILYLYAYAGQQWKSAPLIRKTLCTLYTTQKDGLSGNEDVGQMSAWYVLSSLGLYQVEPAGGKYVFGSPLMDEATVNVGGGKTFRIVAHGNSDRNIYIQSVRLNGKPYVKSYIGYPDIVAGGTLEFTMGPKPSTFGSGLGARP